MRYFYLVFIMFMFFSCQNKKTTSSENTIHKTPEFTIKNNAKGEKIIADLENSTQAKLREASLISYEFQQDKYQIERDCGWYEFSRIFSNSTDRDSLVLDNMEIVQYLKGEKVDDLADSTKTRLGKEMKTELFFAELIFGLNSPTARKKYLENEKINEKDYAKLKVEFIEDNNDQDYLVETVFWIDDKTEKLDFIAVKFGENTFNYQFLKPINQREIEGISFFDYEVYTPQKNKDFAIEEMAKLFEENKLDKKENRVYKNIEVILKDKNCD